VVTTWTVSCVGRQCVTSCYLKSCSGCWVYAFFGRCIFVNVRFLFSMFECVFVKRYESHFLSCVFYFSQYIHIYELIHVEWNFFHDTTCCGVCLKFLLHVTRYSKSRTWVRKVKLTLHVMKAYRGSKSVAALILNLGTRWWVVIFTFQPLCALELAILEKTNLLPLPRFEPWIV
jgi:hypothetical protein